MLIRFFALALLMAGCESDKVPATAKVPEPPGKDLALSEKVRKFGLACGKDSVRDYYDDTTDLEKGVSHLLHAEIDFPAGYFIERNFNGRGDWLFVSKTTCAEIPLFGAVVFNSSRTRFAAIGQDDVAGIGRNGVQIVASHAEAGMVELEWEDRVQTAADSQFGPADWKWEDDSTFSVERRNLDNHRFLRVYRRERGGRWTVHDQDLPDGPPPIDSAAAMDYAWVLSKLPVSLEKVDTSTYVLGRIDNQEYLAIHFEAEEESTRQSDKYLVVARIEKAGTYQPMGIFCHRDYGFIGAEFKDNSIYLNTALAHHGVYYNWYRFKLRDGDFCLVSAYRQSMTPSETASGITIEFLQGSSFNLVSLKAVFWAQVFNMDKEAGRQAWTKAVRRHHLGLPPTHFSRRTMNFQSHRIWKLRGFKAWDFSDSLPDHGFDSNKKFH